MVGCPAAGRRNRGAPSPLLLVPLVGAAVLGTARWSLSFVASGLRGQGARGSLLARHALESYDEPIRRRDGFVQENMQRWIKQQVTLVKKQEGVSTLDAEKAAEKKAAYLAKLGLGDKLKDVGPKPLWHLAHIRGGDVLEGFFSHPEIQGGDRLDLAFKAKSDTAGTWTSEKGGFENDVELRQDFPIAFEEGPKQDMDMTAYIFHKFNMQWRDFDGPYPTADELEHLSLKGMRMWFKQVAEVEGFPSEEDFAAACADPAKGMTKEEFQEFILGDDPEYIASTFKSIFTGRRVHFVDSKEGLLLDGDFQKEAVNHVFGYVTVGGRPGGTFELTYGPYARPSGGA